MADQLSFLKMQLELRDRGVPICRLCGYRHSNIQLFICKNCGKKLCEAQILPDSTLQAFAHFEPINLSGFEMDHDKLPDRLITQCGPVYGVR